MTMDKETTHAQLVGKTYEDLLIMANSLVVAELITYLDVPKKRLASRKQIEKFSKVLRAGENNESWDFEDKGGFNPLLEMTDVFEGCGWNGEPDYVTENFPNEKQAEKYREFVCHVYYKFGCLCEIADLPHPFEKRWAMEAEERQTRLVEEATKAWELKKLSIF